MGLTNSAGGSWCLEDVTSTTQQSCHFLNKQYVTFQRSEKIIMTDDTLNALVLVLPRQSEDPEQPDGSWILLTSLQMWLDRAPHDITAESSRCMCWTCLRVPPSNGEL